jgi:hypothetical protein
MTQYLKSGDMLAVITEGSGGSAIGPRDDMDSVFAHLDSYDVFEDNVLAVWIMAADGVATDVTGDWREYMAFRLYLQDGADGEGFSNSRLSKNHEWFADDLAAICAGGFSGDNGHAYEARQWQMDQI